jgi:hypothetical protein
MLEGRFGDRYPAPPRKSTRDLRRLQGSFQKLPLNRIEAAALRLVHSGFGFPGQWWRQLPRDFCRLAGFGGRAAADDRMGAISRRLTRNSSRLPKAQA